MTPTLVALLSLMVVPAVASAAPDDGAAPVARAAEPDPEPKTSVGMEASMGFFGGVIDPGALPFTSSASTLATPFGPTSRLVVAGPSWEVRSVQSHARFTLGLRRGFSEFRGGALDADQGAVHLSPRSLAEWDVRFGLGGELPLGRVVPFVDLLGDLQFVDADVVADATPTHFTAKAFALSARAGVRVKLDRSLTLGVSGEYGLLGSPRFTGLVTLGWAFGWNL
jgi:hypothetical protein